MVIACGDDPYMHTLQVNPQIYYYGLEDDNDIQAKNVEYRNDGTEFDVFIEDEYYEEDGIHFKANFYPIWAEKMAEVATL